MVTFAQTQRGYAHLWDECEVTKPEAAATMASKILKNKVRYQAIEKDTGVPWPMLGVIHMRESDLNFNTHLHNGDSLNGYTHHVPAGRPKVGHGPPFAFEESAIDAIKMDGLDTHESYTIELMLFKIEGYNGWGYLSKGNSPYVWSWTNEYHGGKYVSDGQYDASVWDPQPGCAAILKTLAAMDTDARKYMDRRGLETSDVNAAIKHATKKERRGAQAGAGGAVAGGTIAGSKATDSHSSSKVVTSIMGVVGVALGLAIVVVAGMLLYRKKQMLLARLHGAA